MPRRSRQHLYLLPNSLTGLSMFLGLWAIMLVIDGVRDGSREALEIACWWIIIATMMDGLDGAVARLTRTTSNFGIQFDSLSDLVTFGVAPAFILYSQIFPWHPKVATGVAAAHAIAGAVRLARFNNATSLATTPKKRSFQGMPIPAAAGMAAALVLCEPRLEEMLGAEATRRLLTITALICAYLMISKVRFLAFREMAIPNEENPFTVGLRLVIFVAFIGWLVFLPEARELLALTIFGGYVVYCVAAALVWRWRLVRRPWEKEEREAER